MNPRSTAAMVVAVMSAAAFGEARAQRIDPHTLLDFIALSGAARCSERTVFEHAVRGAALCNYVAQWRPVTIDYTTLFLNARELQAKRRAREFVFEPRAEHGDIKETRTEAAPIQPPVETVSGGRAIERPQEVYETAVTATPEPASLALVASGLAGLAAYRRRRAKGSEGINN